MAFAESDRELLPVHDPEEGETGRTVGPRGWRTFALVGAGLLAVTAAAAVVLSSRPASGAVAKFDGADILSEALELDKCTLQIAGLGKFGSDLCTEEAKKGFADVVKVCSDNLPSDKIEGFKRLLDHCNNACEKSMLSIPSHCPDMRSDPSIFCKAGPCKTALDSAKSDCSADPKMSAHLGSMEIACNPCMQATMSMPRSFQHKAVADPCKDDVKPTVCKMASACTTKFGPMTDGQWAEMQAMFKKLDDNCPCK